MNFGFLLAGTGSGGWLGTIGMIALVFVVFYFFMIRPQKKQERKDAEMRDALAVGDDVDRGQLPALVGGAVDHVGEGEGQEVADEDGIVVEQGEVGIVEVKGDDRLAADLLFKRAAGPEILDRRMENLVADGVQRLTVPAGIDQEGIPGRECTAGIGHAVRINGTP